MSRARLCPDFKGPLVTGGGAFTVAIYRPAEAALVDGGTIDVTALVHRRAGASARVIGLINCCAECLRPGRTFVVRQRREFCLLVKDILSAIPDDVATARVTDQVKAPRSQCPKTVGAPLFWARRGFVPIDNGVCQVNRAEPVKNPSSLPFARAGENAVVRDADVKQVKPAPIIITDTATLGIRA